MGMNDLYDVARDRLLRAQLDWENLNLQLAAYSGDAEGFDPTDIYQSDVAGTLLAMSQPILDLLVVSGGFARSSAAYFTAIPVGPDVDFFVLLETAGSPAARKLIGFYSDLNNMPFTPNGGGYAVRPDALANSSWFKA
jgi:hypothetical protein